MDADDPLSSVPDAPDSSAPGTSSFPPPPASATPPPPPPPPPPPFFDGDLAGRRKAGPWAIVSSAIAVVLAVAIIVGLNFHLDKRLERPGDATPLSAGVTISGARSYRHTGSFLLLTVFVDDHPTVLHYLKEKLFESDVSEAPLPPPSPVNEGQQNKCDMSDSQATAKLVALRKLKYKLAPRPGVLIEQILGDVPAARTLACGDVIQSVDGKATRSPDDLHDAIAAHRPGERVRIVFRRAGKDQTAVVQLGCTNAKGDHLFAPTAPECAAKAAPPIIGIGVNVQYDYPFSINIDTGEVTGPSGGLAMTLTLLDLLSPCDLTGGQKIAVTGTIDADGKVGGIGGTPKKVIAARHAGAKLFIVAAGSDDLDKARAAAKGMKFIVVSTLDGALKALQQNGGQPLTCKQSS
jgi:PDZ domain-containing protein